MGQNIKNKYAGIILAAGLSSRMNSWKPELIIGGIPLIIRTVKTLLPYCSSIIVVGGFQYTRLEQIITEHTSRLTAAAGKLIIAENKDYEKGMFSSVQKAASYITDDYSGIFLLPGDMPFVSKNTVEMLINEFESGSTGVIIPAVRIAEENKLRKGHPVLFGREVCSAIMKSETDNTLRNILGLSDQKIIETNDPGICFDIDCASDLHHINKFIDY